jgi:hypothetical protein
MTGGSGVTASLGVDVADIEGSPFLTKVTRRGPSVFANFLTFELGIVPRGAMFSSTPCRTISKCGYSIKLGAGGRTGGSTQASMNALDDFALAGSTVVPSALPAVRVCREFEVIVALPLARSTPGNATSATRLAQGNCMRIDIILLLYFTSTQHLEQSRGRPTGTRWVVS